VLSTSPRLLPKKEGSWGIIIMRKATYILFVLSLLIIIPDLWAAVPPPPANQIIGINDGVFNDLTEADCRACHDETVDRHHLLYNSVIPDPTLAYPAKYTSAYPATRQ